MDEGRRVSLFRNGRNQAVRIPREYELPGTQAIVRRQGAALVIEPVPTTSLLAWLATAEPVDEDWPEIADPPPEAFEL
ncbi:MAG: antitoxin [Salinarimonas sp.]